MTKNKTDQDLLQEAQELFLKIEYLLDFRPCRTEKDPLIELARQLAKQGSNL